MNTDPSADCDTRIVRLDVDQCRRVANILSAAGIPATEETSFVLGDIPASRRGNFLLMLVAICHQTQTLHGVIDGVPLRGWDYLSAKLSGAVRAGVFSIEPNYWLEMRADRLEAALSDSHEHSSLSDMSERTELIRNLGYVLLSNGWPSLEIACGIAAAGTPCQAGEVLEALQRFVAYQDPVQKKSLYLIELLRNSAGWQILGSDILPAPVDYHEVRGHLRIGTIKIVSKSLRDRIAARIAVTPDEDVSIRLAVRDAIAEIARVHTRCTPGALHYLFWNAFRNICTRSAPQCEGINPQTEIPVRYEYLLTLIRATKCCPFVTVCDARRSGVYLQEHLSSRTTWY